MRNAAQSDLTRHQGRYKGMPKHKSKRSSCPAAASERVGLTLSQVLVDLQHAAVLPQLDALAPELQAGQHLDAQAVAQRASLLAVGLNVMR